MPDDLTGRLLASPHFRWCRGMVCEDAATQTTWLRTQDAWFGASSGVRVSGPSDYASLARALAAGPVPDDPATLGCMLGLVREAWGNPAVSTWCGRNVSGTVYWRCSWGTGSSDGPTEFAALGEALLAAPSTGVKS